jgi:hypothetical protein
MIVMTLSCREPYSVVSPAAFDLQRDIVGIMREYAGPYPRQLYPAGRLNDVVYPVAGGMEDWAYGASWQPNSVKPCQPPRRSVDLYGPYPTAKTTYDDSQLRAFNILVEAR